MADGINGRTPCMNWDSGDLPGTWKAFKTHCEFMFQGPLKKKQGDEKCAYLMIWVGEKGRNVYSTWDMTAEDQKKLEKYYENFEAYVKPKSNQVFSSYKFQCRLQKTNETCEEFVTDLKVLVKDCQYANPDRMVRDRIVFGTKSSKVREKLINEGSELTLEKALDIARTYELSQRQLQTMNIGEDPNVNSINRKKIYSKQTPKNSYPHKYEQGAKPRYKQDKSKLHVCQRCGYDHNAGSYCPAKGKQCKKCDKKDHFAKMCKTRKEKKVDEIDRAECSNNYDSSDSDTLFVGALYNEKNESDTWCEDITVENVSINFQLDTGARCNVLNRTDFRRMKTNNVLSKPDSRLKSFSGHNIECDGKITLPVTLKNQKHEVEFYVANTKSQSVLGAATCSEVGLIKRVYTLEAKYSDLFTGLGCLPGIHKIHETVEKLVPDIEINEIQLNAHLPISPEKYELFKKQTESDEILQQMKKINEEGWPLKKEELPEDLKMYWQFRNEITCIDNLLYKGLKLIIPTSLRKEMLQLIHETHMGIVKCKTRAREFMYWPGMMSDIQDIVEKCETCAVNNKKTNNKEPMITSKLPDRPSAKLAVALF
ncbi:unnamed protein product [Mytilus edulis]|uniref:Integrase zinc-binding domain-containing protein n=1 Tax=Mytilus edulis TaxID=6550 RepID=A0A8S3S6A4_MYTED|nr:unnamed protein product [Mytilus edulis]